MAIATTMFLLDYWPCLRTAQLAKEAPWSTDTRTFIVRDDFRKPQQHRRIAMEMEESLSILEQRIGSTREIALLRIEYLSNYDGPFQLGLAAMFVPMLKKGTDSWFEFINEAASYKRGKSQEEEEKKDEGIFWSPMMVARSKETIALHRLLRIHVHLSVLDQTLAEELGLQGSHVILTRLINYDSSNWSLEEDQDSILELQDLAYQVAVCTATFPFKTLHLSLDALRNRLPLVFEIAAICKYPSSDEDLQENSQDSPNNQRLLIHQVTTRQSAQEDVGFVMWPSAVALSTWLVSNPKAVQNQRVLELGTGCGLSGLVVAGLQRNQPDARITLSDFNWKVIENARRNIELNNVYAEAVKLDFYEQSGSSEGWLDGQGQRQDQVDVVIAADMICQPSDAVAAANTIYDALKPGGKAYVILGDAVHRFGVNHFEGECRRVGLEVALSNVADLYDGKLIDQNMHLTTGYVDGMTLTMFLIDKPMR